LQGLPPFRQLELQLVKNALLLIIELADGRQLALSGFQRRQHDVDAAELRKPPQRFI
jgi:hypothetical protein